MRRLVYFYSATSRPSRGAMWSIFTPALIRADRFLNRQAGSGDTHPYLSSLSGQLHKYVLLLSAIRRVEAKDERRADVKMKTQLLIIGSPGPLDWNQYTSLEERGFVLTILAIPCDLFKTETHQACEIAVLLAVLSEME